MNCYCSTDSRVFVARERERLLKHTNIKDEGKIERPKRCREKEGKHTKFLESRCLAHDLNELIISKWGGK